MRIGIVTTWFERGAAYVSRQYVDTLRTAGHDVFVFARGGETYAKGDPNWDQDWVHWGRKTLMRDRSGIDIRDFSRWLSAHEIEAVLFNEQWTWEPVLLCRDRGLCTLAYIDYYTEATVPLFALYDALLCHTERHYSVFSWHPGASLIPWGTNTGLFIPGAGWPDLVHPGRVTFFHSAGMSPQRKGTDLVLQAFAQVGPDSHLVVHSQVALDECFPKERKTIKALEKEGRLTCITGTIPAPGLYGLGDVYVYPARLDGIGLTVCEAMACGLPVIVPDHPPMNEFVPTEGIGKAVPVDRLVSRTDGYYWPQCSTSVSGLAAAMQDYVDQPAAIEGAKAAARQYACDCRDWSSNAEVLGTMLPELQRLGEDVPVWVERTSVRILRNSWTQARRILTSLGIHASIKERRR